MLDRRRLSFTLGLFVLFIQTVLASPQCFQVGQPVFCVYSNNIGNNEVRIRMEFPKELGWVGFGIGASMDAADVMMAYPVSNGQNVAITRRTANGHRLPTLNPTQDLQIIANSTGIFTINNVQKYVVTFDRSIASPGNNLPAIQSSSQSFIWAGYAGAPPASATNVPRHTARGTTTGNLMDGSMAFSETQPDGTTSNVVHDAAANTGNLIQAHGILMFLGWVVLAPLAIVIARFFKPALGVWWFRLHWALMLLAAGVFTYVGFGLVYHVVGVKGASHFNVKANGAHVVIGLLIIILSAPQLALGWIIDRLFNPTRKYIPWWDKVHWWLGRIVFLLALVNIPLGIALYNDHEGTKKTWPYVVFGILCALWVGVFAYLQFRVGQRHHVEKGDKYEEQGLKSDSSATVV
ncbi:uncharacterized protein SPPG_04530 [Spizellomyces punctatus DAOM BR117]|uniref:Cytochrome b561 domain-containing protein n=1 Tax=Spizellomyces punctatus (strain DAOM BR117) TaxID=645134 RepID=A0A0L0HH35_SPIPD|nr:uncharacterized protein SPPG_04530 [Spizellomyces punctatus DAOM BR117]KND00190.1 hypothetical protein SPPG_04530 [Spizellomyces punctatus DAOM BR117]|eukprot:XP_016608229.1 hypothetical protein SPPG_04530 [Spizellomyces punctatus DAOM BR117]